MELNYLPKADRFSCILNCSRQILQSMVWFKGVDFKTNHKG